MPAERKQSTRSGAGSPGNRGGRRGTRPDALSDLPKRPATTEPGEVASGTMPPLNSKSPLKSPASPPVTGQGAARNAAKKRGSIFGAGSIGSEASGSEAAGSDPGKSPKAEGELQSPTRNRQVGLPQLAEDDQLKRRPSRQGSNMSGAGAGLRRGSSTGVARPGYQSNTQSPRRRSSLAAGSAGAFCGGDDDDDDTFCGGRMSMNQLTDKEQATAQVQMRRASLMQLQQEDVEARAKEAELRREQAAAEKFDRPKRELLCQRTVLWLQVLQTCFLPKKIVQDAQEMVAMSKLTVLWLPLFKRWRMCKMRRRAKDQHNESLSYQMEGLRLSPEALKKIDFFAEWKQFSLEKLIESMVPDCFRDGEYVMMEGDWGMEMFIIAKGTVDIVIRKTDKETGKKSKKRGREHGIVVASINEQASRRFFGEFSILCHEPRSASVVASTELWTWKVGKRDIDERLNELPSAVRDKLLAVADARRTQNMAKLFPLQADKLQRSNPIFQCVTIPDSTLRDMVSRFEPRVVRQGVTLFEQGDTGDLFYFVASGGVDIRKKREKKELQAAFCNVNVTASAHSGMGEDDEDRKEELDYEVLASLGSGDSFGEIASIFLEKRCATAVVTQVSDLWVLKKDDLVFYLMTMPEWFVAAKEAVNKARAGWLHPCTAEHWQTDKLLSRFCGPRFYRDMLQAVEPKVHHQSIEFITAGNAIDQLVLVTEGRVRDTRTGELFDAPKVFGIPDVLTMQPRWFQTLKAETRCDLWLLPKDSFFASLCKHNGDLMQKLGTKDFQEQLVEEFKTPFQPWENKMAEYKKCFDLSKLPPGPGSPARSPNVSGARLSTTGVPQMSGLSMDGSRPKSPGTSPRPSQLGSGQIPRAGSTTLPALPNPKSPRSPGMSPGQKSMDSPRGGRRQTGKKL